jgi:hypothetical protein
MGGEHGKTTRKKVLKIGQKVQGIIIGEGTNWESSMGKTTRKKVRKKDKR